VPPRASRPANTSDRVVAGFYRVASAF
jgi:hypothetical protein